MKGIFAAKGVFAPRWAIPVLPVLAALGPYAFPLTVAGINLYAFRMLIVVMAVFSTPLTSGSGWWFNKLARWAVLLGVVWLCYGMLSLLWAPDLANAAADLISIGFGFALVLVLFNVRAYESQHLQLLRIGWVMAFVVTAAVALWELVTGQHLYSAVYESRELYFDGTVVQSTLGRPDQYGQFLLLATPFLLWSFYRAKGPAKLIYGFLVAAAGILVLFTASRLSFLGFAAELLVLVFIVDRRWHVIMLGLVGVALGFFWWSNVFLSSDIRLASKFGSALSETEDGSIAKRFALTMNGIWMVYDTAGLGVGAAGFRQYLADHDVPFAKGTNPEGYFAHNWWIQLASEYGILVTSGLLGLLVFIGLLAFRAKRAGAPPELRRLAIVTLVGLVGYLFYGVVTGTSVRQPVHWMFFASLVVMAAHLYQAQAAFYRVRRAANRGRSLGPALAAPRMRPGTVGRDAASPGRILP